jgi:hypothetical protein
MIKLIYMIQKTSVVGEESPLLSTLQPWVSPGPLDNQSPFISPLEPWVGLGLLYSQTPRLSALQP